MCAAHAAAVSPRVQTWQIALADQRTPELALTPNPQDHAALVLAVAQTRDREAFTVLFDHYAPRVNAFLVRLGAERAAAEEMTQDVMVTLWRKAALFDSSKSSIGTWLYRVARNRRIDGLRRDRVEFHDPADFALDMADESQPSADHLAEAQSREGILRAAMERLPAEQMALVRLAFYESLSHSQIAARAGLPLGTVKSRLRLAFSRLRRALEEEGVVEAS